MASLSLDLTEYLDQGIVKIPGIRAISMDNKNVKFLGLLIFGLRP